MTIIKRGLTQGAYEKLKVKIEDDKNENNKSVYNDNKINLLRFRGCITKIFSWKKD